MKKIFIILILIAFTILSVFIFGSFVYDEDLIELAQISSDISSAITVVNIFIFIIFGLLFLLKFLFKNIFNRYITDSINDPIYIITICIILTFIISAIPLDLYHENGLRGLVIVGPNEEMPKNEPKEEIDSTITREFTWKHCLITFIYLFGIVSICLKIFFSK